MDSLKKKKVLIVTHHLTVGGVQKSLLSALKAIDYDKNDVTLYLRKDRTDLLPFVDERVKVIVNKDKHHYYRYPKSVLMQAGIFIGKIIKKPSLVQSLEKQLADQIRKWMMEFEEQSYFRDECYDVAVSYVQGYNTEFVADYVKAKKKVAFYQVSTDELHDVHERVFPQYDTIAVEHEDIQRLLEQWYPEIKDKIVIVENHINQELLYLQSKEYEVDIPKDKISLCSCGRFAKVKGFDLAVKAAKCLKDKDVSFIWYMIGDGPEREMVETLAKEYNLEDSVVFLGMKKNPYPYMANCDIFVQPSYEEALSIAMLEAQMLNRPIVSTKTVGGLSMIDNQKTGLLTEINPEALACGVEMLIKDAELRYSIEHSLKCINYDNAEKQYREQWDRILKM